MTLRMDFRELILAHPGRRFIVMGGSASLAEDLARVPARQGDIVISTNAHGLDLRKADYVLAMDERHSRHGNAEMGGWLRARTDAPIISPHRYADVRLSKWPQQPRFVLSGMIAAWAAWAMGAKVVVLAGCDGYGGEAGYVREAEKIAPDVHCPVRVASGPLSAVWPLFDAKERFGKYAPHAAIEALRGAGGDARVRALKPCTVGRIDLHKGDEITAPRHEVARLLKHRMVVEV